MTTHLLPFILSLSAAVLIAACGRTEAPGETALREPQSGAAIDMARNEACEIVLMPSVIKRAEKPGAIDKSIVRYQQAVANTPDPLPRLERLGWAFVEKARESRDAAYYKLAELTALCMQGQSPDSAESQLLRGHVLHNLHRFAEAEELARSLVGQRGLWFDFALLGDVLMERGALDEAIAAYQRVIDERPGPQAYARVAQLRWLKGDQDGALEMMSQAVRATSSRTPEAAAWGHVRLATLLMQANRLAAADAVLGDALSLKPDYPPALHARGRLLLAHKRPLDAVAPLRRAVQIEPLTEFRWTLYEALRAAGRHQQAAAQEAALRKYGAAEDRRTFALFLAGAGGEPEMALRLALQELEQREDVFTLNAVAWAMSAAGANAEALDYSRRALAEGTRDARLYLHAGVIAARAGEYERAFDLLHKAGRIEHMLLPSEQRQLDQEFAALPPRIHSLADSPELRRERLVF